MAGKKVLVVHGGWAGHTPRPAVDVFIPLLEAQGFEVQVADNLACYADRERLADTDLIVQCWTMGHLEKEQAAGLLAAVEAGTGLAGWHGGIIDAFRDNPQYQFMTGGQWVAHPGGVIPSHKVAVVAHDHPITAGLQDFELHDTEQYYIHCDPGVEVLCQTVFTGAHGTPGHYRPGTIMPYAYTRNYGRGRVFVACWGHTDRDFVQETPREIVRRGLLWAALAPIR
ncbi:MAG: ThuA domain-containing protein [Kiritimatiellia bacterium]